MKLIRKIKNKILKKRMPVKWAKQIGVNFPEGELHLYGEVSWSTEPWIISLGSNVHITSGVKFITHDGGTLLFRNIEPDLEITKPITVGNDVYIGNNVIILPGVSIGNKVIIGAGAVVSKDIPDNSVAVGVPARVFFASTFWRKMQNIFGECCISKLEKVARPRLAAILPAT